MTAFYDFFRFIKLYSTDGTTLEHTIEADAVTDTLSISRGAGVAWTGASAATDSFKIDVNYNLEVPVGTTTLRLTDVHSVDQDIELHAGGNMTITRNHSGSITLAALMGGVSRVITSATQASPVVITTNTVHDFTEGTPVTIVDVVGMTQLNGNEYYADVLTSNTLALYEDDVLSVPLDGTGFTAYTSGGVATGEYAGAKKINDLTDVKFNAPNFADSIMLGYTTTGTLNNAHSNIFIGKDAGKTVTSGNQNTVIGHKAGDSITDGTNNVLIGAFAGDTIQGGDGNVIISAGHSTDPAGGWSNNITSLVTGDGKRRLYIGQENPNVDGTVLDGQYYSNIWHHSTQVGAFRAQGESGGTTVTNPPYATTYLERAYITIDATNNPVIHQPARIHVGGGHLALHGGDGFVVGSTMTEYTPAGQWGASGTRTPGTYTGVTVATGVSGNHPTFTVVVAVSDGSITSVTSETTGSEIFDLTSANTISDSQIGNGGAPDIQFKYEGATTTQAKLTMIGDTNLAVTPAGATINSKDVMLDGAVTSHLIPDTNIAYDLGSATHKFRDLYLDGSSIHLGSTILRDDGAGHLQVNLTNILEIAADDSTIRTINSGESVKFVGAGSVTTATDAEGNLTITGSTNIVNDTSPQLGGGLSAGGFDIDMGVNILTDAKVGNWDTAYGWGDHTVPGYLTGTGVLSSHTDVHNAVPSDGQVLTWVDANSRWEPVTDVETDITGSVFGDDSTVLVDGVNSAINLDGTMKTHMIPALDATYDIGSAEKKIRDLYVDGGGSIWVGGTTKMMIAPYDFQDATFSHYVSLTGNVIEPNGYKLESIAMSTDGTKIYIPQDEETGALPDYARIVQFTLSTPFDLSTITNTVAAGNSFDVSGEINSLGSGGAFGNAYIGGIHFKPDGTKMFMLTGNSIGSNPPGTGAHYHSATKLVEYDLGTPWDITTCAFNGKWSEGTGGGVGGAGYSLLYYLDGGQFKISNDGRFLYTGSTQYVKQFEMATPWDIKSFPWRDTPNGAGSHGNGPGWDEDNDFKIYTTKRWHDSQGLEKDSLIDIWVSDDGWRWFGLFSHGGSNDSIIYGYKMQIKYDIKSSLPFGADIIETVSNGYNPPFPDSIMISGSNHPNGSDGLQTGMPEAWGDYVQSIFFADTGKRLYVAGYTKNYPATDGIGGIQQYNITDSIEPQFKFKGTKGVKIEGEIELASGASVSEISTDTDMSDASDSSIPTEKAVKTYVDATVDAGVNPTGAVLSFAGASAPTGWLLCYGQAISRTTYAGLFTVLAEVYGAGDGSTTFNVPDLRGRTIAGQDDMGGASADRLTGAGGVGGIDGDVLGASGGTEAVSLTEAQMPAHDHDYNNPPYTGSTNNVSGIDVTGSAVGSTSQTGTTGSGSAHVNMQPTLILNYIIKT